MLNINNLKKSFKKNYAVDGLDIIIQKGEIYGFIGPNGAGKSTTIKCILNFLNIDDGVITIDDKKVDNKLKEIIGYLPSEIHLYEDLTVKKMIAYNNKFYKNNCMKKANELCNKLQLDVNKKIDSLSLGNLKKLGIVLTLMHDPKLIILDEPTSGLDPLMQEVFYEILIDEKQLGNTIFFSTHNLSEVKKICDKVAIIKDGKIFKTGTVASITNKSIYNVHIVSLEIDKIDMKKFNFIFKNSGKEFMDITFKDDINKLMQELAKININELLIEEPSLEEVFLEYYKED